MFHLDTPITCSRPVSDFDDISTILTHSSLTGSQKAAPWQQHVGDDGHVFYVELSQPASSDPPHPHKRPGTAEAEAGGVVACALCSTRSCRSCASEDTGYSSDTDALPPVHSRLPHRSDHLALDVSSDSLFGSKLADFEDRDDDGLSVDLQDFNRPELTLTQAGGGGSGGGSDGGSGGVGGGGVTGHHFLEDEDLTSLPPPNRGCHRSHQKAAWPASSHRHHRHHSCTRTASLCERHSNTKLYHAVPDTGSECGGGGVSRSSRTCHCGSGRKVCNSCGSGGDQQKQLPVSVMTNMTSSSSSSPFRTSSQDVGGCIEVVLRLKSCEDVGMGGWWWCDSAADGALWLETVVGVMVRRGGADPSATDPDSNRLFIRALVPGGPAASSKKLCVGDCMESINGKGVHWGNLSKVISSLHQTRKLRMTVWRQSVKPQPDPSTRLLLNTSNVLQALRETHPSTTTPPTPTQPRRRRGVGGRGDGDEGQGLDGVCVLYMSMSGVDGEGDGGSDSNRDVVYQFPREDDRISALRGAFFTLDHLLSDGASSSSSASSSSFPSSSSSSASDADVRIMTVGVDGSDVNVACHKEGRDMLIIAAPAYRLSSSQLLTVSSEVCQLARVLYGSVEEAFSSEQDHPSLDNYLSFLFTALQHDFRAHHSKGKAPLLGYMDHLPLPEDVGMSISSTLTEYESADFADMSDSYYGCRRTFTVMGSMAFYKGKVTCCHLSAKDAGDVGVYLKHSGLLDLSTCHSLHQLLVWREVFPTRLCHEVSALNSVFGYSEPHARWFIMVVGVNHSLLACLLEAGGCSAQHEGVCLPDPFYVDQARAAVLHLQETDIISACEARLSGEGLPPTTTADKLLSLESNHRGLESFLKTTSSLVHSLHNSSSGGVLVPGGSVTVGGTNGHWKERRKLSIESDGSAGSCGSSSDGLFRNQIKRGRLYQPALHNGLTVKPGIGLDCDLNTYKLTSGRHNNLMMFCQVNEQEGVLITSPVDRKSSSSLHRQVVDNFSRCVSRMHADFALTTNAKIYPGEGVLEDIQGDHTWRTCREEGIMFTCTTLPDRTSDSKRASSSSSFVYWVVGRKLRSLQSREVYVCFHEATPQNVVELAFRMTLGHSTST